MLAKVALISATEVAISAIEVAISCSTFRVCRLIEALFFTRSGRVGALTTTSAVLEVWVVGGCAPRGGARARLTGML